VSNCPPPLLLSLLHKGKRSKKSLIIYLPKKKKPTPFLEAFLESGEAHEFPSPFSSFISILQLQIFHIQNETPSLEAFLRRGRAKKLVSDFSVQLT